MTNIDETFIKVASVIAIIIASIITCYLLYFFRSICIENRRRVLIIHPILPF